MNNKKKGLKGLRSICGIDSLDFQMIIKLDNYIKFYALCKENKTVPNENLQKTSMYDFGDKQYTYFSFYQNEMKVCEIGFKNWQIEDNLEYVKISMNSLYMATYGVEESLKTIVEELELMGLEYAGNKITRIDLNTFVYGHNFNYLTQEHFSSLLRSNAQFYNANGELETFYYGKRSSKNSPYLRIYNKSKELQEKDKDCDKQAMILHKLHKKYNEHFNIIENPFWNVEFELTRDYLRSKWKIETVEDALSSVNFLYKNLMKEVRLLERKAAAKELNKNRIPTAPIWEYIENEYNYKDSDVPKEKQTSKRYFKDMDWLLNRAKEWFKESEPTQDQLYEFILRLKNEYNKQDLEKK